MSYKSKQKMTADCKHKVSNKKRKSLSMHNDLLHLSMQQLTNNAQLFQPIQAFYQFVIKRNL